MVHCILLSRYPAADENAEMLMSGGRFKKSVMKLIKEGSKAAGAPVGMKTQGAVYQLGKKALDAAGKGHGSDDEHEGAGRSRLSAEFQKAMKH